MAVGSDTGRIFIYSIVNDFLDLNQVIKEHLGQVKSIDFKSDNK